MGIFRTLRDMRSVEEEQSQTYGDLMNDMGGLYQQCDTAVLTDEDGLITLTETVGDKEMKYFLNKEGNRYTLKLQCEKGLPGVSFLGGPVDQVLYYLTKDLSKACITAHRSDTDEATIIGPKQHSQSFWSEIEGLSGEGMDQLRRLSRL